MSPIIGEAIPQSGSSARVTRWFPRSSPIVPRHADEEHANAQRQLSLGTGGGGMKRPFWPARVKQAPGAKRRATIAALIEQHRARTGEILTRPDIAKILAMSPARVAMHLE